MNNKTSLSTFVILLISALATTMFDAHALERINIEGSPKTPSIVADQQMGVIVIKGRSIPENSIEFYKLEGRSIPENSIEFTTKLELFLQSYEASPAPITTVIIQLSRENDIKDPAIASVFKKLESIHKGGSSKIIINWHYEEDDEDMLRAGEDYQAIINIPFIFSRIHKW